MTCDLRVLVFGGKNNPNRRFYGDHGGITRRADACRDSAGRAEQPESLPDGPDPAEPGEKKEAAGNTAARSAGKYRRNGQRNRTEREENEKKLQGHNCFATGSAYCAKIRIANRGQM